MMRKPIIAGVAVAAFVLGAVAGWMLKPSSLESLLLSGIASYGDHQAAEERRAFEVTYERLSVRSDVAADAFDVAHRVRMDAEDRIAAAARDAEIARRLAAEHAAELDRRIATDTEAVATSLAPDALATSRFAALQDAWAMRLAIAEEENNRTRAELDTERLLTASLRKELDAEGMFREAVEAQRDAATARIKQIEGKRLRWGPALFGGVTLFGLSEESRYRPVFGIGASLMWG